MENEKNIQNIVISDDQGNNNMIYDISDRIFELRDDLSLDIISKNIIDRFDEPVNYETTNYITKFKERYNILKEASMFDGDIDILNNALQEISQLVLVNLNTKYFVGIGDDIDDDLSIDINEYLDKIETLYNFFVVRHYTNIKDYFKAKMIKKKTDYIEKYKMALDDKSYDDLFLSQDKKKFKDLSDAIIVHFINDIISDVRSEITSAYDLFKEITETDLFEEYNNRMHEMIINYGNEFMVLDDHKAAEKYLNILNNDEIMVSLRNDILSMFLIDAQLN